MGRNEAEYIVKGLQQNEESVCALAITIELLDLLKA
jgi:hypothetical protein